MMGSTPRLAAVELIRVVRSGFVESSHLGVVVVTDASGRPLLAHGNPQAPIFPRSAAKPLQALAMLRAGAQLGDPDLAVAAGSHAGEQMHTERVQHLLELGGLAAEDLRCPASMPLNDARRRDLIRDGLGPSRLFMNCSGKHAGMLLACRAAGWDTGSYLDPEHPYQLLVRNCVAEFCAEEPSAAGVDGCGVPLFAVSLRGLARAFGALTTAAPGTDARRVADAMRAFPKLVAGTGRDDTELMTGAPGLLAKVGAEGVHAAALADGRAVAVKIADGSDRARMPVLLAALRWLGAPFESLSRLARPPVLGGGSPVGALELVPGLF